MKAINLLASSEPLLVRDWLDDKRRELRAQGFEDIANLQSDAGFDWEELIEEGDMMSLFASKKCRIVNIVNGKPGVDGSKSIQRLCENPPEDSVFIFVTPSLDKQSKNSAWFKTIRASGDVVELKPVYEDKLVDWLITRARSKGLSIDSQAAHFLADRTEGNLLAADQELDKLSIRLGDVKTVDFETVEQTVSRSARYSHFLLVDACLAGNLRRARKILKSLRAEGYVTAQLRWALQQALEQLDQLHQAKRDGSLSDRSWQQFRIWGNRQRLFRAAMARLGSAQVERLLQSCATLERLGKGQQDSEYPDQDWVEVESLVHAFSGKPR